MDQQGKEFLGKGWAFPFSITQDKGQVDMVEYEKDVQQSIRIILATAKGERVMRPEFGCGIHDLVFGAVNTALIAQIERDVQDALRNYEARIVVTNIQIDQSRLIDGRLDISIDYRIRATNQPGNYVYPFYFKEVA